MAASVAVLRGLGSAETSRKLTKLVAPAGMRVAELGAPARMRVAELAPLMEILPSRTACLPPWTVAARRASKRMAESATWPVMDNSPEGNPASCELPCALFRAAWKASPPVLLEERRTTMTLPG